jgi:hypothetical protein
MLRGILFVCVCSLVYNKILENIPDFWVNMNLSMTLVTKGMLDQFKWKQI